MKVKISTLLLLCFIAFSCKKNVITPSFQNSNKELYPKLNASIIGAISYSNISSHPRLLLKVGQENEIKAAIQTNNDLLLVHNSIMTQANTCLNQPLATRIITGKRLLDVSRNVFKSIFYMSYAYRMTDDASAKTAYKNKIIATMLNVCKPEWGDWNPSHFLDVGEMAMGVSIGYDWIYNDISSADKVTIQNGLKSKAITPSRDSQYNFWLSKNTNWNQVCNTGVTSASLAIFESDSTQSTYIINRYLQTITAPLDAYDPDGNFAEGYAYWGYGTGFQTISLTELETAFGSDNNLSQSPGFLKTADYLLFMTGANEAFNYFDNRSDIIANPAMFYFAGKTNNPSLLYTENKSLIQGKYRLSGDRLLPLTMIYSRNINFSNLPKPTNNIYIGTGVNPVMIIRPDFGNNLSPYIAMKGGQANLSHGHMDAGSFVYDVNGYRWAMDLGPENYNNIESQGVDLWNMDQNSDRWRLYRYNNFGHNTISANLKWHNVDANATLLQTFTTDPTFLAAKFDMTNVLGADQLQYAYRTVGLVNQSIGETIDDIKSNNNSVSIRWSMITPATPKVIGNNILELTQGGKKVNLTVIYPANVTFKIWDTTPPQTYESDNGNTKKVGFDVVIPANTYQQIKVRLIPQ